MIVGVLDLSDPTAEAPEHVAERIEAALAVIPAERLQVGPDCGMKYLPRELAFAKLRALVEGARIVRERLWRSARRHVAARRAPRRAVVDERPHARQRGADDVQALPGVGEERVEEQRQEAVAGGRRARARPPRAAAPAAAAPEPSARRSPKCGR